MTRFSLYMFAKEDGTCEFNGIDFTEILESDRLKHNDINVEIFRINDQTRLFRGVDSGVIQLLGYFDDIGIEDLYRTGFSRAGEDKVNGVVLYQRNLSIKIDYPYAEEFTSVDNIINTIESIMYYFYKIIKKK